MALADAVVVLGSSWFLQLLRIGMPVVLLSVGADNIGAMAEIPTGIVAHFDPHGTSLELADLLIEPMKDPARRSGMVTPGLEYAESHSYAAAADRLVGILFPANHEL